MKKLTDMSAELDAGSSEKKLIEIDEVTIRFAGDSGDGMQLTGTRFTTASALLGNDIATLPDYPAEIRAPAGTVPGVSGFQVHFSSHEIHTPGDTPDVLVAMNPAALKANLADLPQQAIIITNSDEYTAENFAKAGYTTNPLEDGSLRNYRVIPIPIGRMTAEALAETDLNDKEKDRSKNMFVLGLVCWLFDRPLEPTIRWIEEKFSGKERIIAANIQALKAGYHYGETAELFPVHFKVRKMQLPPGTYRNITGNEALALGMVAVTEITGLKLFLGSYPITPASDILHELAKYKNYNVRTFQAEDEIAAVAAAIGAAYSGNLGLTTTSGPGFSLKLEAINLAVMTELPLVIANIQRGGPSTGLPTKTEQADLLQAVFGRNGESPLVVLAAKSPADCFYKAIEAFRIATKFMTPVVLLSDGFIANSSEPWRLPSEEEIPHFTVNFRTEAEGFKPYLRDEETLARPWVKPGTPGLEHRIGGLEKQHITGMVSYDPENHETMVKLRAEKIRRVANDIPEIKVEGSGKADTLIIGWGGTYGTITDARNTLADEGIAIDQIHLEYLSPFPKNLKQVLENYKNIFVAELNLGQLAFLIQGKFAIKVKQINKVKGQPFKVGELVDAIRKGLSL